MSSIIKTAVVINLDYENNIYEHCRLVWAKIYIRMVEAGFHSSGRIFVITGDVEKANQLAREAVNLDADIEIFGKSTHHYIREFYSFDLSTTCNLLVPPADLIHVDVE